MIEENLSQFVQELQDAFLEGRWDEFKSFYQFPVVIYSVAGVKLVRDAEELVQVMEQYVGALRELDVRSTTSEITEKQGPNNQRGRLTVHFQGIGPDGVPLTDTLVRYFLVKVDGSYKIEMMEYLQEPFATNVVERIFH